MNTQLLYVLLGIFAGMISGLVGIGGGVIIVPALIFLFGFSQHQAQGTTLAMLVPPIGFFAAWMYYQQGSVNINAAAFICIGFILGSLAGAKIAIGIPSALLERVFGIFLLLISIKMIIGK